MSLASTPTGTSILPAEPTKPRRRRALRDPHGTSSALATGSAGTELTFRKETLSDHDIQQAATRTHVVIVKLPFSVPDSPLEEARAEWISRLGKSPFVEIALPAASIRLQQAAGRLLRTVDDYGTVTILDRRLATKRWGATLMKGLPDFEVLAGLAAANAISALDSPVPRKAASVGSPGRLMSTDVPMPDSP